MLSAMDRWSRWSVIAMVLLLPVIIYGAATVPIGVAGVHEWLPDGRIQRERYERFLRDFGNDQFVLISWDGCELGDARLAGFRDQIQLAVSGSEALFTTVQTTAEVVEHLKQAPINLTDQQAARRLKGVLVGAAGLCAVVVRVSEHGLKHQAQVMDSLYAAADAVPRLGRGQLRMAGTVVEAYAVDQAAARSLRQLVIPASLLGILLAWGCLRSWLAAAVVLIMAGVGQLMAIATVTFTGGQLSAVLIILPTLVFMLTLSSAVHLMNYYSDAAALHNDHLGSRAMLLGFKPSLLASLTTALGMASLTASQLSPVRQFGWYSSCTLCLATLFLLLSFPALSDWCHYWRCRLRRPASSGGTGQRDDPAGTLVAAQDGSLEVVAAATETQFVRDHHAPEEHSLAQAAEFLDQASEVIDQDTHAATVSPKAIAYTAWMQRYGNWVAAAGLGLLLLSFFGLMFLQSSTKFEDMFPADSPTIRDMRWLEQNLGPIASVEILLHFPNDAPESTYERVEWVDRITQGIRQNPDLGVAMSATTFMPPLPQTGTIRDVARRSVFRKVIDQSLPMLSQEGWLAINESGQTWRVTAKVSATSDEDYGLLTARVVQAVTDIMETQDRAAAFTVDVTGLSTVMHDTQVTLIDDLGVSFSAAFVLITPVMMLIARGFWAGLLIMVPNVLPETVVFGLMAWAGGRVDIAGLLTASVAMGIAVNDTLHFVNWYAKRLAAGDTRPQAIADTLTSCAGAMFHTMLISCCSIVPFLFSDFIPTRQFACLMIAMLSSAILGDLILLPALLLSPLGLCLLPKARAAVSREVVA